MHGILYVCASVYRCICMKVYMYVRVFIGVYAWKLYVCASVYRCICMEVYMYMHVFYVCVDKHGSLYVCASVYRCICTCFMYVLISKV